MEWVGELATNGCEPYGWTYKRATAFSEFCVHHYDCLTSHISTHNKCQENWRWGGGEKKTKKFVGRRRTVTLRPLTIASGGRPCHSTQQVDWESDFYFAARRPRNGSVGGTSTANGEPIKPRALVWKNKNPVNEKKPSRKKKWRTQKLKQATEGNSIRTLSKIKQIESSRQLEQSKKNKTQ